MSQKVIIWCDKIMAFSFYALIYFLPISIALTEFFSGLAICSYLVKRTTIFLRGLTDSSSNELTSAVKKMTFFWDFFKPAESFLNKSLFVFIIINFITIFTSQNPSLSFEGFLGKVLQSVFIFFTFIECMTSRRRLKIFLIIFSISTLLTCVNGLYQYFLGYEFIYGQVFDGRISSSWRQANDFAAYLVVTTPILFYLSVFFSKRGEGEAMSFSSFFFGKRRLILLLLFFMSFICLILTYSRGAWIAFILCLSILGFKNWKIFLLSGVFLSIFFFAFYDQSARVVPGSNLTRYFEWENNRLGYWKRCVAVIKDYPVLGSGLNTYSSIQWKYNIGWGGYPHNSYLQMTAETGVVGLLAFLWVIFAIFINSFKNLKLIKDLSLKGFLLSFLAGLMGFLIHSFFDTNFYSVQLSSFMWLMIGLIVAIQNISDDPTENSNTRKLVV